MTDKLSIEVHNLSKAYKLYDSAIDRLKESLHPFRKKYHRDFYAVNDVSFEVNKGETIGIIGKNGCGKSTLLKIIAGVLTPTDGSVSVRGRVSALLELGTGFNPELTGIENIRFSGTIMGFSREEMDAKIDDVVSFADIGDFVHQPVKMYSSGMFVRLAFAVATSVSPEILIVDEALSVGDIFFQQKCHALMERLMKSGTSVIMVSHDMNAIQKYSTHVMVLDDGRSIFRGQPNEAVKHYYDLVGENKNTHLAIPARKVHGVPSESSTDQHEYQVDNIPDWPSEGAFLDISHAECIGEKDWVRCTRIALCDLQGEPSTVFNVGETAVFFTEYEVLKDIHVPIGGISIINKHNLHLFTKGSLHYSVSAPEFVNAGKRVRFRQEVILSLAPDDYTFWVLFATIDGDSYAHAKEMEHASLFSRITSLLRVTRVGAFHIKADQFLPFYGYADLPGACSLSVL